MANEDRFKTALRLQIGAANDFTKDAQEWEVGEAFQSSSQARRSLKIDPADGNLQGSESG